MNIVRVTKEFHFEMAHALHNYDGKCKYMHGHSYKLFVTITGKPIADPQNPKFGMVMDFGDLKAIVNDSIVNKFDHAVCLSKHSPVAEIQKIKPIFEKIEVFELQPTCENMIIEFAARLKQKLPNSVALHSLKLYETATSFTEWFASDNE
jgi:6-pyruvoyltetrahydropterin/6-carboxytetrahydropterin synthase